MKNILHLLGIHDWEMFSVTDKRGRFVNYHRQCNICDKEQNLKRPYKYHPTKYEWRDVPSNFWK